MGIVSLENARNLAKEKELDLLLISQEANPPVCKIIDYGQFRYQQQKKEKQARKGVKGQVIKELKMSPKISEHDYQVRLAKGREFLKKRFKVKLSIFFKGREIIHPELGRNLMTRYIGDVSELGTPDSNAISVHKSILVTLSPK